MSYTGLIPLGRRTPSTPTDGAAARSSVDGAQAQPPTVQRADIQTPET